MLNKSIPKEFKDMYYYHIKKHNGKQSLVIDVPEGFDVSKIDVKCDGLNISVKYGDYVPFLCGRLKKEIENPEASFENKKFYLPLVPKDGSNEKWDIVIICNNTETHLPVAQRTGTWAW